MKIDDKKKPKRKDALKLSVIQVLVCFVFETITRLNRILQTEFTERFFIIVSVMFIIITMRNLKKIMSWIEWG